MTRKYLTLVIVPEDGPGTRQLRLSRPVLQGVIAASLVVRSVLASLAAGFFVKEAQRGQVERLAQENRLLENEVREIRGQVSTLRTALDDLGERDRHYRLLAGLEPLDAQVLQAGVGGPGSRTAGSGDLWQANPRLGELAFTTTEDLSSLVRRARILSSSWSEATSSVVAANERMRATPSILPADGYISSLFSRSRLHPILDRARPHEGVDISAPYGTAIVSAADGRVVFAGTRSGYGKVIEVDHGYGVVTRYAHASRLVARGGQSVTRGDKIAEVGSTGLSTAPHLHYEVLVNGRAIDPRRHILNMDVLTY
ncbi:MAG TPA: M23 family metallopeptidase [Longimicrobiales bacterium]|nr:M23 family metallopeptidase [Longimicrobiales bacterium]